MDSRGKRVSAMEEPSRCITRQSLPVCDSIEEMKAPGVHR